ncbi:unnamed protein product, partial [Ectocarpus sp. 13 AM-2016]
PHRVRHHRTVRSHRTGCDANKMAKITARGAHNLTESLQLLKTRFESQATREYSLASQATKGGVSMRRVSFLEPCCLHMRPSLVTHANRENHTSVREIRLPPHRFLVCSFCPEPVHAAVL